MTTPVKWRRESRRPTIQALGDGQRTRDLGGSLGTEEFANAVIAKPHKSSLEALPRSSGSCYECFDQRMPAFGLGKVAPLIPAEGS